MTADTDLTPHTFTAFTAVSDGARHLATASDLASAVEAARRALSAGQATTVVVFDDATGKMTEIEPEGEVAAVAERLGYAPERKSGPGRPKLGVVSREVSLLPRHWDWLNAQPGGAWVAVRKLTEAAMKRDGGAFAARQARDAACSFMGLMAGNQPNYEEVSRALYRGEDDRVVELTADWQPDLRDHLVRLAKAASRLSQQ